MSSHAIPTPSTDGNQPYTSELPTQHTDPDYPDGWIEVIGAREHNLQDIHVRIPRNKLTVVTGVSGSGKSSLAFHTIHAEGQRRYVESLSAYARQFLGGIHKPDVDEIRGLSPAIAIDQKTVSHNPRSTVGTVTEIADYARLLWARVGTPHCPVCGRVITGQSVDEMVDQITTNFDTGTKFLLIAPIITDRKGEFRDVFDRLKEAGFSRVQVDGEQRGLEEDIILEKQDRHTIELVVDRLITKADMGSRLRDSLETGLEWGEGIVYARSEDTELQMSRMWACPEHGIGVPEMEPRTFSFNAPIGACDTCQGLGFVMQGDPDLIISDPAVPLKEAVSLGVGMAPHSWMAYVKAVAADVGISVTTPWNRLSAREQKQVMHGTGHSVDVSWRGMRGRHRHRRLKNTGLAGEMTRRYTDSESDWSREQFAGYMAESTCRACAGKRLKPGVLAVTVGDMNISDWMELSIDDARTWLTDLILEGNKEEVARLIVKEIGERLRFLHNVGVGYLSLSRRSGSLSGGESQRLRLSSSLGSALSGCTYVLDEPSVGLSAADNQKLIATLQELRDIGNTVIVVEHDVETQLAADWLVDVGPGASVHGGQIVAAGPPQEVAKNLDSLTGDYLMGRKVIPLAQPMPKAKTNFEIKGATGNNLQSVSTKLPVGRIIGVTGVSGSGKSTLINDTLIPAIQKELGLIRSRPLPYKSLRGIDVFDKVIEIDQRPIGRTPKSNPATYTKIFDHIRQLYVNTAHAKAKGWKPGRFSFNVQGGRCEHCKGAGIIIQEMHFMADVEVQCEVCNGQRYNEDTLQAKWKGYSIADVLNMTVEEALVVFENQPKIRRRLQTLNDVGLSYIDLGASSLRLSGGESQRIKISAELQKIATGDTIYFLDEPSVGLHSHDVAKLVEVIERLREGGNTIIIIEHSLELLARCDVLLDLGEGGGVHGGNIMGQGNVAEIAQMDTPTGRELLKYVQRTKHSMEELGYDIPKIFQSSVFDEQ